MSVPVAQPVRLENSFAGELTGLYERWSAAAVPEPRLLVLNAVLAGDLGLDAEWLSMADGVAFLTGASLPPDATPIAQAYAGHQFGGYSPRLGDGRALLLGEVIDPAGRRRDVHLKGSGRTPFSRGGDGKAAVGPMLREYVIGEALHALGIPATRALAVVATGEAVQRETVLPGALLVRVASSHLRVGSFQYAAAHGDRSLLLRLADYAIDRHHPSARDAANPYLGLVECVAEAQASLLAKWMHVGFIHGVMNTDNMTISGESIDFGPCAFMDRYDPATVFSSIDHGGRYAYGNQPRIAQWNLARLAETLLPLMADDPQAAVGPATEVIQRFAEQYESAWLDGMRTKLGLTGSIGGDRELVDRLLALMAEQHVDFTTCFRSLAATLSGAGLPARDLFVDIASFDEWEARWRERVGLDITAAAATMNRVNPIYIPRNHLVEEALDAATDGDLAPLRLLMSILSEPFDAIAGGERFAAPAPDSFNGYRTFCGT